MSPPPAGATRPDTTTSAKLPEAKGREPWELQDRLGRNRLIEKVIDTYSGMSGNTTENFQKYYSLLKAMRDEGYGCDAEMALLEEWARISGDTQGKNKTQLVQLLEEKNVLLPGAAGLYPPVEPTKGWFSRVFDWATGKGGKT